MPNSVPSEQTYDPIALLLASRNPKPISYQPSPMGRTNPKETGLESLSYGALEHIAAGMRRDTTADSWRLGSSCFDSIDAESIGEDDSLGVSDPLGLGC